MADDARTPFRDVLEMPVLFGRTEPVTVINFDVRPPYALHTVQDAVLRSAVPLESVVVYHNGKATPLVIESDGVSCFIVSAAETTVLACGQHVVVRLKTPFAGTITELLTLEGTVRKQLKMEKPVTKADFKALALAERATMEDGRAKGQLAVTAVGRGMEQPNAAEGITWSEKHAEKTVIVRGCVEPMLMRGGDITPSGEVTCSMMLPRTGNALFDLSLDHANGITDVWLRASGSQLCRLQLNETGDRWVCSAFTHVCPIFTFLLSGAVYVDVTLAGVPPPSIDCISTQLHFGFIIYSTVALKRLQAANLVALPIHLGFLEDPTDADLNAHNLVVIFMRGLCAFRRVPPSIRLG